VDQELDSSKGKKNLLTIDYPMTYFFLAGFLGLSPSI